METALHRTSTVARLLAWRKRLVVLRTAPKLPTAIVLVAIVVAVFAPLITRHSPIESRLELREKPPAFMKGGSMEFPLGTDKQGRPILDRMIVGARISLSIAGMVIPIGGLVGSSLGMLAGYRGGWVDALIMRCVDVFLAFPTILIALVLAVTIGPSVWVVTGVMVLILWSRYARLVRGEVLAVKEREFVAMARIAGCSSTRIILVHIVPNIVNSMVVLSTLEVGAVILVEASLSFLGAGIPPPTPTWGGMVSEGRGYIETLWWVSVFPGLAIMMIVLSFNLFGDWLRDTLDPKLVQL